MDHSFDDFVFLHFLISPVMYVFPVVALCMVILFRFAPFVYVRRLGFWCLTSLLVGAYVFGVFQAGFTLPVPWPDEAHFLWQSIGLAENGTLLSPELNPDRPVYWMPPGYMAVIAGVFSVFGKSLFAARLFSLVCMAGVIGVLLLLIRNIWSSVFSFLVTPWFVLSGAFIVAGNVARMEALLLFLVGCSYLCIAQRRPWFGLTLLSLGPLIHPNGFYFLPAALLLAVLLRKEVVWKIRAVDTILMCAVVVVWGLYIWHIASHWNWFMSDMNFQFARKAARPIFDRVLSPEAISLFASICMASVYTMYTRHKATIIGLSLALPAWCVGWIGLEMWYDIFIIGALLIMSAIAARMVLLREPSVTRTVKVLRWLTPVAVMTALVTWNIRTYTSPTDGGIYFPTRTTWKGMVARSLPYLGETEIESVSNTIRKRIPVGRPATIQFIPGADAFFFMHLRSDMVQFSEPLFIDRSPDYYVVRHSAFFPPYLRLSIDQQIARLGLESSFAPKNLIEMRDTSEVWFLIDRSSLPDFRR